MMMMMMMMMVAMMMNNASTPSIYIRLPSYVFFQWNQGHAYGKLISFKDALEILSFQATALLCLQREPGLHWRVSYHGWR